MKQIDWLVGSKVSLRSVALAVAALAMVIVASAQAADLSDADLPVTRPIFEAQLTRFEGDKNLFPAGVHSGSVLANPDKGLIKIGLQPEFSCPVNAFCATVMPSPFIAELKVVKVEINACGIRRVIAEAGNHAVAVADRTKEIPLEGDFHQLILTDRTVSKCDGDFSAAMITVELRSAIRVNGKLMKFHSRFEGDRFYPIRH